MTLHGYLNPQPVSLADELRKLVERWRKYVKGCETACDNGFEQDWSLVNGTRQNADELSALLDQHAVAEPQRQCWYSDNVVCPYSNQRDDKPVVLTPAHAAEQPKLTPRAALTFETWWEWFKGGFGETGAREEDIARCAWIQSKAVQRALLTSPVAPPPPKCVGYPDCDGDLVATAHSPECPCYNESEWREQNEREAAAVKEFASQPPVAPGEPPPQAKLYNAETYELGDLPSYSEMQRLTATPPAQEQASGSKRRK